MTPLDELVREIGWASSDAYHAELWAQAAKCAWTRDEDDLVRRFYPNFARLLLQLPRRSEASCRRRAKQLGIRVPCPLWTVNENAWMRKNYSTALWSEIEEHLPRRTKSAVICRAGKLRLRREPKELPLIGVYLIDEVRLRAKQLNLTLRDLDEIAGLKTYFQTMRAKTPPRRIRLTTMEAVLEALGGRLVVEWSD